MDFRVKRFSTIRILASPQHGWRAVTARIPEAEAWAGRMVVKSRPLWLRLWRTWRRLATAAVVLLTLWLSLHVMFGANGMVIYRQKRAEYNRLRIENDRLQKENELNSQRIKALSGDPQTIEKEAREQLHYTRPGEFVYVAPTPVEQPKPSPHAAQK
jgi:cell division protein FtsB